MAINKNHEFEELGGIKCAIVERNVSLSRVSFLESLLGYNGYEVVSVPTPAAKPGTKTSLPATEAMSDAEIPATFTVGVTDTTFNPVNAIFGRLLKTPGGRIVTISFWKQQDAESRDDIPYYDQGTGL